MQIKFNIFWTKNLGTLYKDNSVDVDGIDAIVDLDLSEVNYIYVNFAVGPNSYTDTVVIKDVENKLVTVPFKTDVLKEGLNQFELVATMKNGDVKPSQTYQYNIAKSLENPNSVIPETNYPILIDLIQQVEDLKNSAGGGDVTKAYVDTQDTELNNKITVLNDKVDNLNFNNLEIINNNLFDYTKILKNHSFNNGTSTITGDFAVIPVEEFKIYTTDLNWTQWYFFDKDDNYLSFSSTSEDMIILKPAANATKCLIKLKSIPISNDITVVEGTNLNMKTVTNNSRWFKKRWLVIGDSISTYQYVEKSYPYHLGADLGFKSCTNISISGKTMDFYVGEVDKYSSDYDLVTVMLGTNNQGYNTGIGTIDDAPSTSSTSFYGQVKAMVEKLIAKNPLATIGFLTPIRRADNGIVNANALGKTVKDYVDVIKEVCELYGVPCLDLYEYGLNPIPQINRDLYFSSSEDGTHPNNLGHSKFLAPKIKSFLESIAPFEAEVPPPPSNKPVESVSLDKTTHTFKVDETVQLTASILPVDATNKNISWSSSDNNKATVVNGLVTAKAEGNCSITVTTEDGGKTDTCNLTIEQKDVSPQDVSYIYNFTGREGESIVNNTTQVQDTGSTGNFPITFTNNAGLSFVSDGLMSDWSIGASFKTPNLNIVDSDLTVIIRKKYNGNGGSSKYFNTNANNTSSFVDGNIQLGTYATAYCRSMKVNIKNTYGELANKYINFNSKDRTSEFLAYAIVYKHSNKSLKCFVNGEDVGFSDVENVQDDTSPVLDITLPFSLKVLEFMIDGKNETISNVNIYKKALTQGEIQQVITEL